MLGHRAIARRAELLVAALGVATLDGLAQRLALGIAEGRAGHCIAELLAHLAAIGAGQALAREPRRLVGAPALHARAGHRPVHREPYALLHAHAALRPRQRARLERG